MGTGDAPGQCEEINDDNACRDGSCGRQLMCKARGKEDLANCSSTMPFRMCESEMWDDCDKYYKGPNNGASKCEEKNDLMCNARDGKWAGRNICLKKKFLCDNYLQCEDGKDEEQCEDEYLKKRVFPKDYHYICKSPFLVMRKEENWTGKFFPMRAIRCDTILQCPNGDDEEGCFIPDSVRQIMTGSAVLLTIITYFSTPIL